MFAPKYDGVLWNPTTYNSDQTQAMTLERLCGRRVGAAFAGSDPPNDSRLGSMARLICLFVSSIVITGEILAVQLLVGGVDLLHALRIVL